MLSAAAKVSLLILATLFSLSLFEGFNNLDGELSAGCAIPSVETRTVELWDGSADYSLVNDAGSCDVDGFTGSGVFSLTQDGSATVSVESGAVVGGVWRPAVGGPLARIGQEPMAIAGLLILSLAGVMAIILL